MLEQLRTKSVGVAGLAIGAGTIVASVAALFHLFTAKDTGPQYLIALAVAADDIARRQLLTSTDQLALAQLGSALIGIIGAITIALLMTWLGLGPGNTGSGAPQAPTTPTPVGTPGKDNP